MSNQEALAVNRAHWGGRIVAVLLFGFAYCYFSSFFNGPVITIYQARDIHRAWGLLSGHWIWHGPDLSGGGTAPGPFYYWLLALPLSVFGHSGSLVWFQNALASASAVLFWSF